MCEIEREPRPAAGEGIVFAKHGAIAEEEISFSIRRAVLVRMTHDDVDSEMIGEIIDVMPAVRGRGERTILYSVEEGVPPGSSSSTSDRPNSSAVASASAAE
jgi:hypothetical protein